ncbi:MAG: FG-GAP-like repeat-containing protein [Isosphaeraceae bacterium]
MTWPRKKPVASAAIAVLLILGAGLAGWHGRFRARDHSFSIHAVQSRIQQRQYAEARATLLAHLSHDASDDSAWLMLGGLEGLEGRDEEALAAFGHVEKPGPARAQARALQGELYLKQHDAPRAEHALRAAMDDDPKSIPPRLRLVYLLQLEQRTEEARRLLWELYDATHDARHLITLVGMTLAGEDSRDPKPEIERFLAQTPNDPWMRRARGLVLAREGRFADAQSDLEAASRTVDDDPAGRITLAECHLAARALDESEQALGAEPPITQPRLRERWWLLVGRIDEARGEIDNAIEAWGHATGPESHEREALYALGQALVRRGEPAQAQPLLARAEEERARGVALIRELDRCLRDARDPATLERVANLCEASGLHGEARAWFGELIRVDATHPRPQRALAAGPQAETEPVLPRLREKAVIASAPAKATAAPVSRNPLQFDDIASSAGLDVQYNPGATSNLYLPDTMGGGIALLDYNGDGHPDIYLVNGCALPVNPAHPAAPNRLFRNNGDRTFTDVTQRAGLGGRGYGMGCAVGDYDDDGRPDLFLTGLGATVLYHNRGDGTFEDVTTRAGVSSNRWTTAAGFADLDQDGDLDLVVVAYVDADPKNVPDCRDPLGKPMHCPPGHFPAQPDHLFRNNGDGTFTDVARDAGLDVPAGLGLGLALVDLDDDGKTDIFVANDAAPNFFFRNRGRLQFEELGVPSGLAYDGTGRATASMGVIADDMDGDGRIDIFHTNFLNEPNTLHHNLGGGLFADRTREAGLDAPSRPVTGFGTILLDADNDGLPDLFVANGHVDDRPWAGHPMAQPPHLYRGIASGTYQLERPRNATSYFASSCVGRGAAAGDLDGDGRVDLVVVHRDRPLALLRNTTTSGHWLGVRLVGQKPRDAFGARVTIRCSGRTATRWLASGTGYLTASEPVVHFGLGEARAVDQVEVRWPSGRSETWLNPAVDRVITLREGTGPSSVPRPASRSGRVGAR